ncbi:transposase-like protein [Ochrobactrum sp. P6BSIII]|nr:transposase-like protein [Ochrobactrum sp. P6BSIII]
MAVDFKGAHFPKSIILHAVFLYVRYPVSYCELQEVAAERGITVDHATLSGTVNSAYKKPTDPDTTYTVP